MSCTRDHGRSRRNRRGPSGMQRRRETTRQKRPRLPRIQPWWLRRGQQPVQRGPPAGAVSCGSRRADGLDIQHPSRRRPMSRQCQQARRRGRLSAPPARPGGRCADWPKFQEVLRQTRWPARSKMTERCDQASVRLTRYPGTWECARWASCGGILAERKATRGPALTEQVRCVKTRRTPAELARHKP